LESEDELMAYQFPPDVEKMMRQHMVSGGYSSEVEVLRDALQVLGQIAHTPEEAEQEYRETVAAVRDGMADVEHGRVRPLRDLIDEANGK